MPKSTEVAVRSQEITRLEELSVEDVLSQIRKIQEIMQKAMRKDEHYGIIKGTKKPTLLKPGAEKLCLTFRLDPQYESIESYDGNHLTVKSRCTLYHITTSQRMGSGEGSCSTKESKYAYRQGSRKCPACGEEAIIKGKDEYGGGWICWTKKNGCNAKFKDGDPAIDNQRTDRIPNEDLADQYNTILKMSNKRSLVAAVLNVTAASDIFTQDMEDLGAQGAGAAVAVEAEESRPQPQGRKVEPANGVTVGREFDPTKEEIPTGKYAGTLWSQCDQDYLRWVAKNLKGEMKIKADATLKWIERASAGEAPILDDMFNQEPPAEHADPVPQVKPEPKKEVPLFEILGHELDAIALKRSVQELVDWGNRRRADINGLGEKQRDMIIRSWKAANARAKQVVQEGAV